VSGERERIATLGKLEDGLVQAGDWYVLRVRRQLGASA
jgi:hypothetical protein